MALLALVPAWVYLTQRRRHVPSGSRTTLSELLELVSVAAVTTGVAALLVTVASAANFPGTLSLTRWARDGDPYLAAHPLRAALNLSGVLALAAAAAYGLCRLKYRESPEHDQDGDVWWKAFDKRPKGTWHYVGVMLDDGNLIEGLLVSFSTETALTGESRDIALKRPIRLTAPGGQAVPQAIDRIVIPQHTIRFVTVVHASIPAPLLP
jgi:hypothetical protein